MSDIGEGDEASVEGDEASAVVFTMTALMKPLSKSKAHQCVLKSLASSPLPKPIEKITTPIMVIQPGQDNIFPVKYTKRIFKKLTCKKRLKIFKPLSHTLLFDNPEEVAPSVLDWLQEVH